jgi:hypothetical protein
VRAHARQRLRHQRRHAAVQHLERLSVPGGHTQAARTVSRSSEQLGGRQPRRRLRARARGLLVPVSN